MLNTLTKPRFQTFVKIFQGPTDRQTDTPSPRSSSSELKSQKIKKNLYASQLV